MKQPWEFGNEIKINWEFPSGYAIPYIDALCRLGDWNSHYVHEHAFGIAARFLVNASTWKGDVAKRVKSELKKILKEAKYI